MSNVKLQKVVEADQLVQAGLAAYTESKQGLEAKISEIEQERLGVARQRDALAESSITFEDYCQLLREGIDWLGAQYAKENFLSSAVGTHPDSDITWTEYQEGAQPQPIQVLAGHCSMPALCFLFPDVIYQRICNALTEKYRTQWTSSCNIPYAQRAALIEEIDKARKELTDQRRLVADRLERLLKGAMAV